MTASSFRHSVRTLLRERLLDAAGEITADAGWADVTMAKIAGRVGVSRQTVYNELGSKSQIAEDLVLRELERFLTVVSEQLRARDDVISGLHDAAEGALLLAEENAILKAALTSAHVGSNELLPLLTTNSEQLIERASSFVLTIVEEQYGELGLTDSERATAVEAIVRLVLSHMLQPHKPASGVAADIAWIADRLLD